MYNWLSLHVQRLSTHYWYFICLRHIYFPTYNLKQNLFHTGFFKHLFQPIFLPIKDNHSQDNTSLLQTTLFHCIIIPISNVHHYPALYENFSLVVDRIFINTRHTVKIRGKHPRTCT